MQVISSIGAINYVQGLLVDLFLNFKNTFKPMGLAKKSHACSVLSCELLCISAQQSVFAYLPQSEYYPEIYFCIQVRLLLLDAGMSSLGSYRLIRI